MRTKIPYTTSIYGTSKPTGRPPASMLHWIIGTLIILLIVALTINSLTVQKKLYRESSSVATQNMAHLLERNVSTMFETIDAHLASIALYYQDVLTKKQPNSSELNAYLAKHLLSTPTIISLRITDAKGIVRHGTDIPTETLVDLSDRDFFIQCRDSRPSGLVVSGPLISRIHKQSVIVLARCLEAPNGSFKGIIYADVIVSYFEKLFSSVQLGKYGTAAIYTSDLRLVYRVPDRTNAISSSNASKDLQAAVQKPQESGVYVTATEPDGIEQINAFYRLEKHPFIVVAGQASQDYIGERKYNLIILFLLTVTVALATIFTSTQAYRSSQKLEEEIKLRQAREEDLRLTRNQLQLHNTERQNDLRMLIIELTQAEQRERDRLYSLLHDEVQPLLVATRLLLNGIHKETPANECLRITNDACEHISQVLRVARTLSHELSTSLISERGLIPALQSLCQWARINYGLKISLQSTMKDLPADISTNLNCFRIIRELLLNVFKHAHATEAIIELQLSDADTLRFSVTDNGVGFPSSTENFGSGLSVIEQRLKMLGGTLQVESSPTKTTVSATLKLTANTFPPDVENVV